ncbi:class I tRNA ligase family protein [Erysipelothrix sp. D19-032]
MHTSDQVYDIEKATLSMVDRHIIHQFNRTLDEVNRNMDKYEYALVGNTLQRFVWDDFCSWYIELSKSGLQSEDETVVYATKATLAYMLKNIVKVLHPFMPFVTEEIYQSMPGDLESINLETWPSMMQIDTNGLEQVTFMINAISGIRELRVQYDVKPSKPLTAQLLNNKDNDYEFDVAFKSDV